MTQNDSIIPLVRQDGWTPAEMAVLQDHQGYLRAGGQNAELETGLTEDGEPSASVVGRCGTALFSVCRQVAGACQRYLIHVQ